MTDQEQETICRHVRSLISNIEILQDKIVRFEGPDKLHKKLSKMERNLRIWHTFLQWRPSDFFDANEQ